VTNDDYPPAAIRAEASGTTSFRLDVDAGGRVTNCTVTGSSGNSLLDSTACSLLKRRARFGPAEDASGNKIPAVYNNRFRWELPKE
jgi:protein TonB